jgi:SprT protein
MTNILSPDREQCVITATHAYIRRACKIFGIKQQPVDISFDLKGRAAGMYRVKKKLLLTKREIRYNPFIFSKYFEDNLENTVPHEVAHYACDALYGMNNIKPHGTEWKQVMQALDADPKVTASYDLTDMPLRKMKTFSYRCSCGEQRLSSIRHNRVMKHNYQYYCKACRQILTCSLSQPSHSN